MRGRHANAGQCERCHGDAFFPGRQPCLPFAHHGRYLIGRPRPIGVSMASRIAVPAVLCRKAICFRAVPMASAKAKAVRGVQRAGVRGQPRGGGIWAGWNIGGVPHCRAGMAERAGAVGQVLTG